MRSAVAVVPISHNADSLPAPARFIARCLSPPILLVTATRDCHHSLTGRPNANLRDTLAKLGVTAGAIHQVIANRAKMRCRVLQDRYR